MLNAGVGAGPTAEEPCLRLLVAPQDAAHSRRWRPAGGMPGWLIVLIAAGSALVACALTLLAVRATRRATPAQPSPS